MQGHAARRGLLLIGIMITAMATTAVAGTDEAGFRRWGVGWGSWSQPGYSEYNGPGLRYRIPSGWAFTFGTYFSASDADGSDYNEGSYDYATLTHDEPVTRLFALETARLFALNGRLELGPALRLTHLYSRNEGTYEHLYESSNGIDWSLEQREFLRRSETYSVGLGLRPQLWPHPRVSVESSLFLYWQKHHRKEITRTVSETESDPPELFIDESRDSSHNWAWSYPTPSVTMSLVLFFHF